MKKLKELRQQKNYTISQFAKLVKISPTYYWQIENGGRRLYYDLAMKIAKVFNKRPDDIFFDYYK